MFAACVIATDLISLFPSVDFVNTYYRKDLQQLKLDRLQVWHCGYVVNSTTESPPKNRRKWPLETRRKVRNAYITGKGSVLACAQLFGVPQDTAQDWADLEDWTQLRRDFETQELQKILPASPETPPSPPQDATTQTGKLAVVEEQLKQLDEIMKGCTNPDTIRKLWDAKNRALDAWALLTGFPRPGVRKTPRGGQTGRPWAMPSAGPVAVSRPAAQTPQDATKAVENTPPVVVQDKAA